jgi:hypothetical protein
MPVKDVDKGFRAMAERIYRHGSPSIAVGILAGEGADEEHREHHEKQGQVTRADRALRTLLEIAVYNEFGTARIPARSFIRAWFDEALPQLREDFFTLEKQVLQGKISKERALDLMAVRMVGQVQERIAAGLSPPLADSTGARKGSSTPLIDSGQLRSGVTSRVKYE